MLNKHIVINIPLQVHSLREALHVENCMLAFTISHIASRPAKPRFLADKSHQLLTTQRASE